MAQSVILRAVRALESLVFAARPLLIGGFCLITLGFAWEAVHARLEAGLDKQIPPDHPYVQTAKEYGGEGASGNVVEVALQAKHGTIFTAAFFKELSQVTDAVSFLPGVNRAKLTDILSPNVHAIQITEDGYTGDALVPDNFKPDELGFAKLKADIINGNERGTLVGQLVSNDFSTALIIVPLYAHEAQSDRPLDYLKVASLLETGIKEKFEAQYPDVEIRITGAVRAAGEIARGIQDVELFFLITLVITGFLLYRVSHHIWLTASPLLCSLSAVIWQIGLLTLMGRAVDVYSMLIPFLILSIGVSHGVQMILSTGQLAAAGHSAYEAARQSFRRLFLPGAVALVTAIVTFLTITAIKIPVIQELAVTATLGIGALAFTNLLWLPLMVSYARIRPETLAKMQAGLDRRERFWHLLAVLVQPRYAVMLSVGAGIVALGAFALAQNLVVGDLNPGSPDLRPSSRFNQDTVYILDHFGNGTDSLVVYAVNKGYRCAVDKNAGTIEDFEAEMRFVPGVHGIEALPDVMKADRYDTNERNPRWKSVSHEKLLMRDWLDDCDLIPVTLYLTDHKASTLTGVIEAVNIYAASHPNLPFELKLAGGNGGMAAATNQAVDAAQLPMLGLVYLAMMVICSVTFRSPRAVICIIVPLALVSLIANGAMALLGIGLKVSTLPVTALGVGIGVDYGIYKFSRLSHYMGAGMSLQNAYIQTLRETGSAVIFTGLTLSVGVATWVFSPLQFQADMGLLLTLMFFMNMVGAIILLPALIGVMQIIMPQRVEDMGRASLLHQM